MVIGGAVGFYLGIDTPQLPFHSTNGQPSKADEKIDTAKRAGHVSRGVLVFCCGGHDCTPPRSAHRLDDNDHGGMGGWRGHANHCWSDGTPSPLRRPPSPAPPPAAIFPVRAPAPRSSSNSTSGHLGQPFPDFNH